MELPMSSKKLIAIIAVVVVVGSALYVAYDFNDSSLDFSGREARLIRTNSMDGDNHPAGYDIGAVPQWSLVMVKKLDSQEEKDALKVGDVITFNYSGRLTVHRIIAEDRDSGGHLTAVTTRGDNAGPYNTENPAAADITGIVVGVSVWMGSVVHFIQSSTLLFGLMVVLAFIMISAIWDIAKITRRKQE